MREISVLGHKQVGVAKSILVAWVLNPTTLVAVPDSVQLSISFTSSSGISLFFSVDHFSFLFPNKHSYLEVVSGKTVI